MDKSDWFKDLMFYMLCYPQADTVTMTVAQTLGHFCSEIEHVLVSYKINVKKVKVFSFLNPHIFITI